jgi:hypothetical protein
MAKRDATAESQLPLRSARKEIIDRPTWKPYFQEFKQRGARSAEEYKRLLRDAGFVLRRFEFVTEEVTHPSADALKGCARSTWHRYTDRIPAKKRDAFLDEVVQRCIELHSPDREGRIRVRMSILEVEATVASK